MANTLSALRELADQLTATPTHPAVLETLRRELHRVHGTAGTYGYVAASQVAGAMEHRALSWSNDEGLEPARRGSLVAEFITELEQALDTDQLGQGGSAPSAGVPQAVASAPPAAAAASATIPTPRSPVPTEPPKVIIVEDDVALAEMLRYALESASFRVEVFDTGPEALQSLLDRPKPDRPILVLMDVDLPGLDGHAIHERLEVQRPGSYPTVFVSARINEADQIRAFRRGAIDYLTKPVSLRVLLAKVPVWFSLVTNSA